LFSRVMRDGLFTSFTAWSAESVLLRPILSEPRACTILVNSL
jgi:hypothetical protein